MTTAFPYAAAALVAALFSQTAAASCYVVYGPDKDIVYRAPEPPVDMSRQIHALGGARLDLGVFSRQLWLRAHHQQAAIDGCVRARWHAACAR